MWIRSILSVILGAYGGGVIASYVILLALDGVSLQDPTLSVYPFYFALGIMFFTFPGAIMVAGIFNLLVHEGYDRVTTYALTGGAGTLAGGMVLGLISSNWNVMAVGAFYGACTSIVWMAVNSVVGRTTHSKAVSK
jgi:hypothetical protein